MKQQGIGTVIGTTTSDVLKKLKEAGQEAPRRAKAPAGRDTVQISAAAREMLGTEEESDNDDIAKESVTTAD